MSENKEPVNVEQQLAIIGRYLAIHDCVCRCLLEDDKSCIQGFSYEATRKDGIVFQTSLCFGVSKETIEDFSLCVKESSRRADGLGPLDATDDRELFRKALITAYQQLRWMLEGKIHEHSALISQEMAEQQKTRFKARREAERAELQAFSDAYEAQKAATTAEPGGDAA